MKTLGRFIGLAFVAVVLSGLLLITFAPARPGQPIEVLGNEYPQILSLGRSTFSFSVVAREPFKRMEIRFITLTPKDLAESGLIDPAWQQGISGLSGVLGNVRKLVWFDEDISQLGISPERLDRTVTLEGRSFDLLVHDYSDSLVSRLGPSLLGRNVTLSVPLVFAVIANQTHYQYLEGNFGFFVKPAINVRSLLISHNNNETKYAADDEIQRGSVLFPISQAPRGIVTVESVDTDDTITVAFGVEPLQFIRDPKGPAALLQMIRVYLDGEPYGETIVNVVR